MDDTIDLRGKPLTRQDILEFARHPMFNKPLSVRPVTLEEILGRTPTQQEIDELTPGLKVQERTVSMADVTPTCEQCGKLPCHSCESKRGHHPKLPIKHICAICGWNNIQKALDEAEADDAMDAELLAIDNMSDVEVMADLRAKGVDVETSAAKMRDFLNQALADIKKE